MVYAIGGSGTTSVYSDITVRKINKLVTGSVYFDGNDHLSIGSAGDFNFLHNGATDWTAEFWAKVPNATRQFVFGTGASSAQTGFSLTIMSSADNQADSTGVYASVGRGAAGNYRYWGVDSGLVVNTWHHIAAVFKSSDKTLALYIDGREVDNDSGTASGTFGSGNYSSSNSSYAFIVGKNQHGGGNYITGYISNLRVVAGRRLYTSDFTPPVHELELIDGTRILCCNNPDSVTAVSNADIGTGHIGTSSGNPTFVTENPGLTRDFTYGTEFRGVTTFDTQAYFVPPSGTTEQRGRGRGLIAGGYTGSSEVNNIEYVTIASSGNAQDFGDLTVARRDGAGCASATRGLVFAGGFPTNTDVIDYVEISSTSNAIDFGDTTENSVFLGAAVSNSTRGVFAGGIKTASPIRVNPEMQYVTIASRGDTLEFGELSVTRYAMQGAGSPTRGMFFGGAPAPAPAALTNTIDYITIAATGNAVDFGDISVADRNTMACSNSIRSVIAGGQNPSQHQDRIEYVTNASTGNAQDFGNLIVSRSRGSAASSQTRGLIFGGYSPSQVNTIDYITFTTTGNATNFGDTTQVIRDQAGFSDSHGGLS